MKRVDIQAYFEQLQASIINGLAKFEPTFVSDHWTYASLASYASNEQDSEAKGRADDSSPHDGRQGGGVSRYVYDGAVFASGGVNFSGIGADHLPKAALQAAAPDEPFFATGVSLVLHPHNPYIPTIHMNVRYFETDTKAWFGGGIDLTPTVPQVDEVATFHQTLRDAVLATSIPDAEQVYADGKAKCDDYFTLPHRAQMRGVGGVFYDHLAPSQSNWTLIQALGDNFLNLYVPLIEQGYHKEFDQSERDFQLFRRGRYVEFNLLWDRGTKFGIESGGRAESILMSLPAEARWQPGFTPQKGSWQALMDEMFYQPGNWCDASWVAQTKATVQGQ